MANISIELLRCTLGVDMVVATILLWPLALGGNGALLLVEAGTNVLVGATVVVEGSEAAGADTNAEVGA